MLPVRVLHRPNGQFYGYGPSSQEIEAVTSVHRQGTEPIGMLYLFGRHWELQERSFYSWNGMVYMTWRAVNE